MAKSMFSADFANKLWTLNLLSDLLTLHKWRLTGVKLGQEIHMDFHSLHCVQSTQHGFFKVPLPRDFSLPRPAKLSAHLCDSQASGCCLGGPRGEHTVYCRSFGWQDICSSGLATKTLIFFIWEQIMQQSVKSIKRLSIPMYSSPWTPLCTCM